MRALDAAMPFDFEARAKQVMETSKRLRIGIIGFGTFGQFLASRLVQAGHEVGGLSGLPALPKLTAWLSQSAFRCEP